jgi:hypothetical protein
MRALLEQMGQFSNPNKGREHETVSVRMMINCRSDKRGVRHNGDGSELEESVEWGVVV